MKNMKKLFALLLTVAMVLSLAACGSSAASSAAAESETAASEAEAASAEAAPAEAAPAAETEEASAEEPVVVDNASIESAITFPLDEEETFTIFYPFAPPLINMGYDDPADLLFFKTLNEWTNVRLDFTVASVEVLSENFNLMVASGDYPDIISQCVSEYSGGAAAMVNDEVIVDIAPYLDEYAPHYKALMDANDEFRKFNYTDDGQLPQFMSYYDNVYVNQGYFYRTDWAEELGMDAPKTYDDWFEYLSACKTNYDVDMPANGVPHTAYYGYAENDIIVRDGQIVYVPIDEEIQSQMMPLYEKWFNAGLYTVESQLDGYYTDSDLRGFVTAGNLIMCSTDVDQYKVFQEEVPIEAVEIPVLNEGDTPYRLVNQNFCGNGNTISTACEDVETLVAYMDYWYTDEVIQLANWGIEGETYTIGDDGQPQYTEEVLNFEGGLNLATSVYCAGWEPTRIDFTRKNSAYNDDQLNALDLWNEFSSDRDYPNGLTFTEEEQQVIQTTFADIQTYVDENYTKFRICESTYDKDFESYVETVESMGIQDVIDVYQAAYDRFQAR